MFTLKKTISPQNTTAKSNVRTANISNGKSLHGLQQNSDKIYNSKEYVLQAKMEGDITDSSVISKFMPGVNAMQFGGWKTGSLDTETKGIKASASKREMVDTYHHKISQNKLEKFYLHLLDDTQRARVNHALGIKGINGLLSLRANLTLGPVPEHRAEDPREGLDPNRFSDGSMTPRSRRLSRAERIIDSYPNAPMSDTDLDTIITEIQDAKGYHELKVRGDRVDGDLSMWRSTGKTARGAVGGFALGALAGTALAAAVSAPLLLPALGIGLAGSMIGGYLGSKKKTYSKGAVDEHLYPHPR